MSLFTLSSVLFLSVPGAFSFQESYGDVRLSLNLASTTRSEVLEASFIPGTNELVFRADRASMGLYQLYRAPADGSAAPEELHPSSVSSFELSPDGNWVVFRTSDGLNVRSPSVGGTSLLLANVVSFRITPDSTRIVYLTTADRLFVAPLDGSTAPVLLADLSALGILGSLIVTPDSTRVLFAERIVFASLEPTFGALTLYSIELSGGAPVLLTPPLPVDRHHMSSMLIDPSSTRALYMLNELIQSPFGGPPDIVARELFSVPLDGSAAPVRLNDHGATDSVLNSVVGVDPSGNVVFDGNVSTNGPREVFHVPLDGSASPLRLHAPLPSGGGAHSARLTANGSRVAFVLFPPDLSTSSLYSAPSDGSSPEVLLTAGEYVVEFLALSPDGTHAVYRSAGLRSVRLDGSAASVTLVPILPPGMEVIPLSVMVSGDSTHVLFRGDLDTLDVPELYSVPIGGGARVRLNAPLTSGGNVSAAFLPTSGDRVAYLRQASSTNSIELHANKLAGFARADVSQLGAGLAGTVREHAGGNGRVVYRADHLVYLRNELFSVPLDGSAEPVRLHATPITDGNVLEFRVSAAAGRVVFLGDVRVDTRNELFSAPLDGSVPAVLLHPALATNRNVTQFALTPDGTRTLYLSDASMDEVYRLFSVPTDASAAPVGVNGSLVSGGDVRDFAIDSTGTRFAYLADQTTDEVVELWARPLDLSTPAVRISTTPVFGGDVDAFVLAPDGTRVVYRADALTNGVFELFVAPLDGSAPAVRLSPALGFNRNVQRGFVIDPTSSRVVFRADALVDGQDELFSAPLDASTPAVRLNPTLPVAGNVTDFQLDALGQRVVFRTYTLSEASYTLYSAPLDGSVPATFLTQPEISPGLLIAFSVEPSGEHVLFYGLDPINPPLLMLSQRRIDGTGPEVRLSPPGVSPSGSPSFFEDSVIYSTDSHLARVPLQGGPSVAVTRAYETGPNFVAIQEGRLVFKAGPGGSNTELYATRLTPKVRRR